MTQHRPGRIYHDDSPWPHLKLGPGDDRRYLEQLVKAIFAAGLNWQVALARTLNFSEYMLYGVFVREVLGYDAVDHAPSTVPLVKPSWGTPLTSELAIDAFFADFDPRTRAVMIHSKDNIDPARFRHHLEHKWNAEY